MISLPTYSPGRILDRQRFQRVPFQDYCEEVFRDLPMLIQKYPAGVYISHLIDWYGESINRTVKVCETLATQGRCETHKSASHAIYIVPIGYSPTVPLPELTELQRTLVLLVLQYEHRHKQAYTTSYVHLSKTLTSSYGGVRNIVRRTCQLGYLILESSPSRGKVDSVVLRTNHDILRKSITPPPLVRQP